MALSVLLVNYLVRFYRCCILFLGLSIMQNGKIPYFMGDDNLKIVFGSMPVNGCLSQLRQGFKKFGIYQVSLVVHSILFSVLK